MKMENQTSLGEELGALCFFDAEASSWSLEASERVCGKGEVSVILVYGVSTGG